MENKLEYFLSIAEVVGTQSTCRKKVGAIIVDPKSKYIISTGYCGAPAGVDSCIQCGGCMRQRMNLPSGSDYTQCRSIHAEQNAILQAGVKNTEGCYLYLVGQPFICDLCKRFIIQAKIAKVYYRENRESKIMVLDLESLITEMNLDYFNRVNRI